MVTAYMALCPDCSLKAQESRGGRKQAVAVNNDHDRAVQKTLALAERCTFFCHHRMFRDDGTEDPEAGLRTCSFSVRASCGHIVLPHPKCAAWQVGQDCHDRVPAQ